MHGRVGQYATFALVLLGAAASARAQDEVIADPELSGGSSSPANADGDEAIADPELSGATNSGTRGGGSSDNGWGDAASSFGGGGSVGPSIASSEEDTYDPMANTGTAKIEISGQQGIDIHRENYLEDFFESRLRFGGETDFRISRKLRLSTGARLDFFYASPNPNDSDLKKYDKLARDYDRYEFDIVPLSMYVDTSVADGVHLRVGVQPISLGRMDFFSPTDMLVVYDTRPAPKADPASAKLAQMAVKLDWDLSSWATLQLAYIPWFMPHVSRPNQDRFVGAATSGINASRTENPYGWLLAPSQQPMFTQSTLRYLGPAPDFTHPQAEARLNMRGSSFELALLGGTAVEKVPFAYYGPEVVNYLAEAPPTKTTPDVDGSYDAAVGTLGLALGKNRPIVDVEYPRYYLLGLDGSFDIAPISIGFEAAFSPSRMLYAATRDGSRPPLPNVSHPIESSTETPSALEANPTPAQIAAHQAEVDCVKGSDCFQYSARDKSIRKGVPVVQGALHVEWINEEKWALVAEAFMIQALAMPYDESRDWLGFIKGTGTFAGGIIAGSYRMLEDKLNLIGSVILLPGLSVIAMPMAELKVADGLYANIGIQIFEGPAPGHIPLGMRDFATPFATNLTAGGVFSGYDQVTLGFRWLPGN